MADPDAANSGRGVMYGKAYSDRDRQYFSGYVDDRAKLRPEGCHGGLDCWVEFGHPALTRKKPGSTTSNFYCVGCGGTPAIPYRLNYVGRYAR